MRYIKYLSLIGIVLFAFILSTVDLMKTIKLILSADATLLFIGFCFVILEVLVRSYNWRILASIWAKGYNWADAVGTYLIGIAFGSVTPGKAGDFIKIGDLKDKTTLSLTKAFTVGLLDRLINFIFLFMMACGSIVFVGLMLTGFNEQLSILILPLLAIILALTIILNERASMIILKPLQNFFVPQRFHKNMGEVFKTFHETISEFKTSNSKWKVLILTIMGWLVIFTRPYFFGKALGIDISLLIFLFFTPIISVVEVLPISVMGLGTRDVTIVFLFTLMGVDRERMVALSAIILLLSLVPQIIAGYLIAWSAKDRNIKDEGTFS